MVLNQLFNAQGNDQNLSFKHRCAKSDFLLQIGIPKDISLICGPKELFIFSNIVD